MKEFIEIPFGAKDSELGGWEYNIPEGYTASIENGKIIVKKESDWSEEDEEMISFLNAICVDSQNPNNCASYSTYYNEVEKAKNWLKSLKDRVFKTTWKPSNEQMKGIDCAIKTLRHQLNVEDKRLNSLYEQLKKL